MGSSILGGLSALFGGNPATTTTTNTNTSGTSNLLGSGTSAASTNPILSSLQNQLSSAAGANAQNANLAATNLTGYTQQGLENINNQNSNQALTAQLEGSGMEYSPAAANAQTSNQLNRINQGNQFLAGVPLLQTQLQQQALSGLNSTFSSLPTATQSQGANTNQQSGSTTSNTSGTQTTAPNPTQNLLSGLGSIIGYLGF